MRRCEDFAHVSDLHIGRSERDLRVAVLICRTLLEERVSAVLVTGDITHRGRLAEWRLFEEAFGPLLQRGRVVAVPGNHDRLGDDLRNTIMPGERVQIWRGGGLHVVRFDSTAEHNRSWLNGHGHLDESDGRAIEAALAQASQDELSVLMLHHHLTPQRHDSAAEQLISWLGYPFADELAGGGALLQRLEGRCDLVLHGHRHRPHETSFFRDGERRLLAFNAGSSTQIGAVRVFSHIGRALAPPRWIAAATNGRSASREVGGPLVPAPRAA